MSDVAAKPARVRSTSRPARVLDKPGAAEALRQLTNAVNALSEAAGSEINAWECIAFNEMAKDYALPRFMTAMVNTSTEDAEGASQELEALLLNCAASPDPADVTPAGRALADAAMDSLYAVLACLDAEIQRGGRAALRTWTSALVPEGAAPSGVPATTKILGSAQVGADASLNTQRAWTVEQYRAVLEMIALRCYTLTELLTQAGYNPPNAGLLLEAAHAVATYIGSMADGAVGGRVIGSPELWNYGPNFEGVQ